LYYNSEMPKPVFLSGIQPTGVPHIGNYLGAIKKWVEIQDNYETFIMVADLHAITIPREPKEFKEKTLEIVALLLACGIDPKKSTLFIQSQIPAHTELAWILNTITPLGELERMTQFKEKKDRAGALAGLLNYPVLQAADILLYKTNVVPVGEDQFQHLEFARAIAKKFNSKFGETFIIPEALSDKITSRIMGLDNPNKKMSKSAKNPNNYIALLDSPEIIRKKIKSAVTDSGKEIKYDRENKPAIANMLDIYAAFSEKTFGQLEIEFREKSYAEFKEELTELLIAKLTPIQKKYKELSKNKNLLEKILENSKTKASKIANKTLLEAKEKVGFII